MNVSKCFWQCAKRKQHTKDSKLNVICQVLSLCMCVYVYCGPVFVCVNVAFFVLFHFQLLLFVFAMARKLISWLAAASPVPLTLMLASLATSLCAVWLWLASNARLMCFKFNFIFSFSFSRSALPSLFLVYLFLTNSIAHTPRLPCIPLN